MAEFPALTLWTDAYLSDTRCLTTLEHGAYLLLLMEAWRRPHCDLPDDDRILSRLAGMNLEDWMQIRETILAFWTFDGRGKTWRQKRLMIERDRARVRSKSQRDKAVKRWTGTINNDAPAMPTECPADAPTATATATATAIKKEEEEYIPLPPSPPKKPKRAVGVDHPLPADWKPSFGPKTQIMIDRWPDGMLEREDFRFRNHAASKGRLAKNWDAAFAMWISNADERKQGSGYGQQSSYGSSDKRDGFTRSLDRAGGFDPVEPPGAAGRSDVGDGGADQLPSASNVVALR